MNKSASISDRIKKRPETNAAPTQIRQGAKKPSITDRIVTQKKETQKKVIIRKDTAHREATKPDLRENLQRLKHKPEHRKDSRDLGVRAAPLPASRPMLPPYQPGYAHPYPPNGNLPGIYGPPGAYPPPPYGYFPIPHPPQPTFVKIVQGDHHVRDTTKSFVVAVTNIPEHYQDQRQLLGLIPSNVELRGVQLNQGRAQLHFIRRHEAMEVESKYPVLTIEILNDTVILNQRLHAALVENFEGGLNPSNGRGTARGTGARGQTGQKSGPGGNGKAHPVQTKLASRKASEAARTGTTDRSVSASNPPSARSGASSEAREPTPQPKTQARAAPRPAAVPRVATGAGPSNADRPAVRKQSIKDRIHTR